MPQIILHQTPMSELEARIGEIVEKKLRAFTPNPQPSNSEAFLTRAETCDRLHICLTTLHYYTKDGILPGHRIGGRVLYKASEVETALQKIQTVKNERRAS